MNTNNVYDMSYLFAGGCISIDWEIDMSNCMYCHYMLADTKLKRKIKLKNVPKDLDLSEIGTDNYIIINYKEDIQDAI